MNHTADTLRSALDRKDFGALVGAIPYATFLGVEVEQDSSAGVRVYRMPFRDELIGSASKQALHGGTVAGLLELSMQLEVLVAEEQIRLPYPVDFSIDYWRSAQAQDCLCSCRLVRSGRRVAQVQAECWQSDRDKPVAFARADFLLRALDEGEG